MTPADVRPLLLKVWGEQRCQRPEEWRGHRPLAGGRQILFHTRHVSRRLIGTS
jgi:hypothetical protein